MRHLIGVGLAIVMAAATFFLAAWGYVRLLVIPVPNGPLSALPAGGGSLLHNSHVLMAMGALALPALLGGVLIAMPQISPLAAGLPGAGLLAWSLFYLASVHNAVRIIPFKSHIYGYGFEAMLFDGVLAFAGAVMIIPLFIPSRWRPMYTMPARDEILMPTNVTGSGSLLSSSPNMDWTQTSPQQRLGGMVDRGTGTRGMDPFGPGQQQPGQRLPEGW